MTAVLYTPHYAYFTDDNGAPLSGGKLYTYDAGTSTPKATYTTSAGDIEQTNPVVLDAYGRAILFLNGAYKFVLKDSEDNTITNGTTDNVTAFSTDLDVTNAVEVTVATDDKVLLLDTSNGDALSYDSVQNLALQVREIIGNGIYLETIYYTSSGTFTKASYPNAIKARITVIGGGGGGGGADSLNTGNTAAGGGGGGGGSSKKDVLLADMGASETVTVGAGGTAGSSSGGTGGTGGTSSFGSHLTATGGSGGVGTGSAADADEEIQKGGAGGVGSSGDINITGGAGTASTQAMNTIGGNGGSSILGGGGGGGEAAFGAAGQSGSSGGSYGGGGGGGANGDANGTAGSVGASGIIIVELYS